MRDVQSIYERFARREALPTSPLYARLALAVAEDDRLARFVSGLPDAQPNLLFAALQYLVGRAAMPRDAEGLYDLIARRGAEVAETTRARRVQTNEVGRCAVLLPALPPGPLALLEVGASAGLNLAMDRYAYRYGQRLVGAADATLTLRPRLRGPFPAPGLPDVVWRLGLDVAPLDVCDDDAVRWLAACVWADDDARHARLAAAVATARRDPPRVERGDLVDDVPRLAALAPVDATLVVFHSGVLPYVREARRAAFAASLAGIAREREVVLLSYEAAGVVERLPPVPRSRRVRFVLGRWRSTAGGAGSSEALAIGHPHGTWCRWLVPAPSITSVTPS
jgi:hypothetical protein